MSAAIKETQTKRPLLIQIQRRSERDESRAGQNRTAPPAPLEKLREEVAQGFLYAHSRANVNSSKLLEVAAFSYAMIELLAERGVITVEELDERKAQVGERLAEKFAERGMGVALTTEEQDADRTPLSKEIDCDDRLHL